MENTENKNVVIEEKDVEVNEVAKIEKKQNPFMTAGKWVWARRKVVLGFLAGIGVGYAASKIGGSCDDGEYETTDYEVSDVGTDEGPTED